MPVKFYTPRLVIRNITHNKAVAIFDEYRIQPGEQIDIFDVFDPLDLEEDRILKALEKPWGDLQSDMMIFSWDYGEQAAIDIMSQYGMDIEVKLEHDVECIGTAAVVTFYCISELG